MGNKRIFGRGPQIRFKTCLQDSLCLLLIVAWDKLTIWGKFRKAVVWWAMWFQDWRSNLRTVVCPPTVCFSIEMCQGMEVVFGRVFFLYGVECGEKLSSEEFVCYQVRIIFSVLTESLWENMKAKCYRAIEIGLPQGTRHFLGYTVQK